MGYGLWESLDLHTCLDGYRKHPTPSGYQGGSQGSPPMVLYPQKNLSSTQLWYTALFDSYMFEQAK
jgi:hypothetical protein